MATSQSVSSKRSMVDVTLSIPPLRRNCMQHVAVLASICMQMLVIYANDSALAVC
jgi:hypothetical protein